jgi:hypothetical protein
MNGFGGHRIEGIGDKHVPWIHNVRNTDTVIAVDDEHTMRLLRLFNEPEGRRCLEKQGVSPDLVNKLDLLGISSIGNMLAAIKFAKYYELDEHDIVLTVFTDSLELYGSRLGELEEERGAYSERDAAGDYAMLQNIGTDWMLDLGHYDRKRIHNLKYYTWIEQQGRELDELNEQWYSRSYWDAIHRMTPEIDRLIEEFNGLVRSA